jgi:phosphate:Na+ symporter
MTEGIVQALGGLGLFLLGMVVMTQGLQELAGEMLRQTLTRFTHSPLSGSLTGTVTTAILQSSSATTVAAVGFVSAGLLTFSQALGIIFGANLGTTITGWMVAIVGFKLKLGSLALPFVLAGTLLRLFGRDRLAQSGYALAGFGLIFVGIDFLQSGMSGLHGIVQPEDFPPDSLQGRLLLVLLGVGITLVTQSSSAGVATALTAVYTGTITFPQAAALVIGMDVGTTVTALLATLGRSVESRRTGYSHVIYNLFTAGGAFLLLSPYVWLWESIAPGALATQPEIALVAFHTCFNALGVIAVLPFAEPFGRFIKHLVPRHETPLLDRLDANLLKEPALALSTVQRTLREATLQLLGETSVLIETGKANREALSRLQQELDQIHLYVDQIHLSPRQHRQQWPRLNAAIHILDHLQRLHERCDEEPDRAEAAGSAPRLDSAVDSLATTLQAAQSAISEERWSEAQALTKNEWEQSSTGVEPARDAILAAVGTGELDVPLGTDRLEALRWLNRVSYHLWRICSHLQQLAISEAGRP